MAALQLKVGNYGRNELTSDGAQIVQPFWQTCQQHSSLIVSLHATSRPQSCTHHLHFRQPDRIPIRSQCAHQERTEARQNDAGISVQALARNCGVTFGKNLHRVWPRTDARQTRYAMLVGESPER